MPDDLTRDIERVSLSLVLGALMGLEEIGEGAIRAETAMEAARFFHALASVPNHPAYRGRLVQRSPATGAALVDLLIQVSDAYRCAVPAGHMDEDLLEQQADACGRLASFIGATMEAPHPADSGVHVLIEVDERGKGEIVIVHIPDEEREEARRLRDERRRSKARRRS